MAEEIDEFAMFRARALGAESEYLLLQQASRQQRSSPRQEPAAGSGGVDAETGGRSSVRRRHASGTSRSRGGGGSQGNEDESGRENGFAGGGGSEGAAEPSPNGIHRRTRQIEKRSDSSGGGGSGVGNKQLLSPGSFEDDDVGQQRGLQRTHSCRSTSKRSSQHQLLPTDVTTQQYPCPADLPPPQSPVASSAGAHSKFNRNRTMTMPVRRRTASSSRTSPRQEVASTAVGGLEPSPGERRRVVVADVVEPEAEISGDVAVYRVRNFTTKSGSVINRGDSIKVRNRGGRGLGGTGGGGGKASPGHENGPGGVRSRPTAVRRSSSSDSHPSSPGGSRSGGHATARDRREAMSRHSSRGRCSQDDERSMSPSVTGGFGVGTSQQASADNGKDDLLADDAADEVQEEEEEEDDGELVRHASNGSRLVATGTVAAAAASSSARRHEVTGCRPVAEEPEPPTAVYKVLVLGSQGVGKTTLVEQMMTSEYLANKDNNYNMDDDVTDKMVSVQVDDEESVIQFIDIPGSQANKSRDLVDANLVVYSVTDRVSFQYAQSCLQELRPAKRHNVVILVANKQDIVRNRVISEEDGKNLAARRHCKFIEVSALLDHRMDELLVGITRQIRLRKSRPVASRGNDAAAGPASDASATVGCIQRAAVAAFRKLFRRRGPTEATSCDDLFRP